MLNEELGEEVQIVKRETNDQEIYQIYLGDKHIYTTDPSVYDVATFDEETVVGRY